MNQYNVEKFDLGTIFSDLEIIDYVENIKDTRRLYLVKCKHCGREKVKNRKDLMKGVGTSHQACSNAVSPANPRFYRIWQGIRSRTTNPNQISYQRGYNLISSEEYKYFIDFHDDMWLSYIEHVEKFGEEHTTLDRIHPEKDYTKENLRWATRAEQNSNTKKHLIKYKAIHAITKEEIIFSNQTNFSLQVGMTKSSVNKLVKGYRKQIHNWMIEKI